MPIAPVMPPVQTDLTPAQNVWTCPTCRHGSSDPRDEAAHLDAHRQLGQFFQEWDAAVARDRNRRRVGRRLGVVLGVFLAIVVVVASLLFWSFDGGSERRRPVADPRTEVPTEVAPRVVPPADQAPPSSPAPQPAPAQPDLGATVAPPTPVVVAEVAPPGRAPASTGAAPPPAVREISDPVAEELPTFDPPAAPQTAAPQSTSPSPALRLEVPPLHVCLLQVCLNVG